MASSNDRRNTIMMGQEKKKQGKLYYYNFSLENRVRSDHPLRKMADLVDFDFAYDAVRDKYGHNGNVSVPPPVILKLMVLLILYNVRSERELMDTLPERLDWLWFLGFDLDSAIPNHSVLSKARKRWGPELFRDFFERVVWQCVEAGLVDGKKIFVDSSLVDANASTNSVIDTNNLRHQLKKNYHQLESRLSETHEVAREPGPHSEVNKRYISSTDPDATIVRRGKPKLCYQVHRAVDEKNEIITATTTTAGDVNEAHEMFTLVDCHERATECTAETVVADSKYGTIDNFLACHDRGLHAHIPDLHETTSKKRKRKIFSEDQFQYDPLADVYICPAGTIMPRRATHTKRRSIDYGAPRKRCAACELREQCTKNKLGRTIKRHIRQEELEAMRQASRSAKAKRDIKTRQHLMERSFARGERLGFDRARWRGLWRMEIQECLTCIVQNIQVLLSRIGPSRKAVGNEVTSPDRSKSRFNCLPWKVLSLLELQRGFFVKDGWLRSACFITG
jgi:transposase